TAVLEQIFLCGFIGCCGSCCGEFPKELCGSRPNWTEPDLVAFAQQTHLMRRVEADIADFKVEYLLDSGSRVEHESEQGVITPSRRRSLIDPTQQCFDLRYLQIIDRQFLRAALERDTKHTLKSCHVLGKVSDQESRECVQSCQPRVARGDAIVAFRLQMP